MTASGADTDAALGGPKPARTRHRRRRMGRAARLRKAELTDSTSEANTDADSWFQMPSAADLRSPAKVVLGPRMAPRSSSLISPCSLPTLVRQSMHGRMTVLSLPSPLHEMFVSDRAGSSATSLRDGILQFHGRSKDSADSNEESTPESGMQSAVAVCGSFSEAEECDYPVAVVCPPAPQLRPRQMPSCQPQLKHTGSNLSERSLYSRGSSLPEVPRLRSRYPSAFTLACLDDFSAASGSEMTDDWELADASDSDTESMYAESTASPQSTLTVAADDRDDTSMSMSLSQTVESLEEGRITWGIDVGFWNGRATVQFADHAVEHHLHHAMPRTETAPVLGRGASRASVLRHFPALPALSPCESAASATLKDVSEIAISEFDLVSVAVSDDKTSSSKAEVDGSVKPTSFAEDNVSYVGFDHFGHDSSPQSDAKALSPDPVAGHYDDIKRAALIRHDPWLRLGQFASSAGFPGSSSDTGAVHGSSVASIMRASQQFGEDVLAMAKCQD